MTSINDADSVTDNAPTDNAPHVTLDSPHPLAGFYRRPVQTGRSLPANSDAELPAVSSIGAYP